MKKNVQKLQLKKEIVARLSKAEMNAMGAGTTIVTDAVAESNLCPTGKIRCYVYTIYSAQSCTQYCN